MKALSDWLKYIELPRAIQYGAARLEYIRVIARRLEIFPIKYKALTVAGTNGKGSTVAVASQILQAAGYKIGTFTSPHLLRYNERIAIDNTPVNDEMLCQAFSAIESVRDNALSYFEYSFLAALYIFHIMQIQVAVLEVGMGGRLDAVNAIDADVAIITTVDLDHMQQLGDTHEKIGFEKAGIFRHNRPAIFGDVAIPDSVIAHADFLNTLLYRIHGSYDFTLYSDHWKWQGVDRSFENLPLPQVYLPNAATAIMAVHSLNLNVSEQAIIEGLQKTSLPGRQQIINQSCQILLDVAHNPQAARLLAQKIEQLPKSGKIWAIYSGLADKDIAGTIIPLRHLIDHWYYAPLQGPRAASITQLSEAFTGYCATAVGSIDAAYEVVKANASKQDWLIVYGSFYTVATMMKELA